MGDQLAKMLRTCLHIEEKMAELYRYFATLAAPDDADLADLWEKTAQEEDNHVRQFELAHRVHKGNLRKGAISQETADAALAAVVALLDRVKKDPPSAEQALWVAVELEEKLTVFHMDAAAVVYESDSIQKMFHAMMAADRDHIGMLRARLAEFAQ